jgi:hypothetical protein
MPFILFDAISDSLLLTRSSFLIMSPTCVDRLWLKLSIFCSEFLMLEVYLLMFLCWLSWFFLAWFIFFLCDFISFFCFSIRSS